MYTGVQTFNKRVGVLRFFFTRITMAPSDSLWHFFDFFHHQGRSKKHEILLCYLFLKKTARYNILETIKPNIETKKQFCFFNFVFEVMEFIKWVMIDNMITQNLDMKCKIVFRILTTVLHSSSSWFAKSDLFRLNSIKNVSLKKTFFGALHYDLLYCIPKIFFRFSNRIYYENDFM